MEGGDCKVLSINPEGGLGSFMGHDTKYGGAVLFCQAIEHINHSYKPMIFSSKALTLLPTASTHRTGFRACTDRMITPSERYRRTHGQDVQEAWAKTWISTSISSVIADTVQNAGVRHGDGVRSCPTPMRAARRSACLALGQRRQENLHSWLLTRALTTTDTGTHGTTEPAPDSAEMEWRIAAVTQNYCFGVRLV